MGISCHIEKQDSLISFASCFPKLFLKDIPSFNLYNTFMFLVPMTISVTDSHVKQSSFKHVNKLSPE